MFFWRRELRCYLLLFAAVIIISTTFYFSLDYVQPPLSDSVTLPKIGAPGWFEYGSYLDEGDIQESKTEDAAPSPPSPSSSPPLSSPIAHEIGTRVETTIPGNAFVEGITVLDNLYMRDGIMFILTSDENQFPSRSDMMGRADHDLGFLEPSSEIIGVHAIRISGLSLIIYDPPSTMNNFYMWWSEIILGAWRVYSKLGVELEGKSTLALPSRFILPFVGQGEWRDDEMMTGPLMRAAFPHASIEGSDYWEDLTKLNSTVLFDRVILLNREATFRHPYASRWLKMISGAMKIAVPFNFWLPVRTALVQNMLGDIDIGPSTIDKPIVAYFSRQGSKRRLEEGDHEGLVKALRELERDGICELYILEIGHASLLEIVALAAKSTVLVGVHGTGLTHQLWMAPSPRSTVLEIVWPKAYVFDYEIVARNLGHKHYAVWNDTLVTSMEGISTRDKGINYEEFDSNKIPVHGPAVAKEIKARLLF